MLPITLYHFFRYPLYSIILNLLVLPLVPPLFLLGTTGLLLTALLPVPGSALSFWILLPCRWILMFFDQLCTIALRLPGASSLWGRPKLGRILLFYGLLALFCLYRRHLQSLNSSSSANSTRRSLHSIPLLAFRTIPIFVLTSLPVLLLPMPSRSLSIVFLDVGQGDCAFLETPAGTTILIDSGSSDIKNMADQRLIPFLESRGIAHLDYVFLSHTDQDHISGILDWLESGGTVGLAILPALNDTLASTPSYQQILSVLNAHAIPIRFFYQGMQWQEEELTLTCMAPVDPNDSRSNLYSSLNSASTVLLAEYQGIRVLFTGDCEKEGEQLLLSYLQEHPITCHLLKAGHHGSTHATGQELLTHLQPQAVIISCGIRNRYGHPHPTMLERVKNTGSQCYVTASCGAVSITIHQNKAQLTPLLPAGPLYYR